MQHKMSRFKLGSVNRVNFKDKFKFLQKTHKYSVKHCYTTYYKFGSTFVSLTINSLIISILTTMYRKISSKEVDNSKTDEQAWLSNQTSC